MESLGLVSFVFFSCADVGWNGKHSNDRATRYRDGQHYESFSAKPPAPCVLWKLQQAATFGARWRPAHSQARDSDMYSVHSRCHVSRRGQSIRTVSNYVRRTLWSRRSFYFFFNSGECVCLWWALGIVMLRFPHLESGNPPAQPCKSALRYDTEKRIGLRAVPAKSAAPGPSAFSFCVEPSNPS